MVLGLLGRFGVMAARVGGSGMGMASPQVFAVNSLFGNLAAQNENEPVVDWRLHTVARLRLRWFWLFLWMSRLRDVDGFLTGDLCVCDRRRRVTFYGSALGSPSGLRMPTRMDSGLGRQDLNFGFNSQSTLLDWTDVSEV